MLKLRSILKHILLVTLIAAAFSLAAQAGISAEDQAKYNVLSEQLKTIQAIRVYMSFAPGSGHQYATMTVMRYLRHLGFGGEFDLVYANELRLKNPVLLKTLFPFVDIAKSGKQCSNSLNLCVSGLNEFKTDSTRPKLQYGITGADDGYFHSQQARNASYIGAKELKVAKYIMLQPLEWGGQQGLDEEGKPFLAKSFPGSGLAFFDAAENLRAATRALEKMQVNPSTQTVGKNLKYLLDNIEKYDIQTLYGIGLIPQIPEVVSLLGAAVAGLNKYARQNNMQAFTHRPKLMLIFSNLNEFEWTFSAHALGAIDSDLQPLANSKTKVFSIEEAQLVEQLSILGSSDHVGLIKVGRVDQALYHAFKKGSDIPAVVAGKNALDEARTMGVPFFNSVADYPDWYIETEDVNFQQPANLYKGEVNELRKVTALIGAGHASEEELNLIRKVMVQSFTAQSNFYKLFRVFEMNDQNRQYRFDKIAQMLMFAFTGAM